jgi:hypothetical protein
MSFLRWLGMTVAGHPLISREVDHRSAAATSASACDSGDSPTKPTMGIRAGFERSEQSVQYITSIVTGRKPPAKVQEIVRFAFR